MPWCLWGRERVFRIHRKRRHHRRLAYSRWRCKNKNNNNKLIMANHRMSPLFYVICHEFIWIRQIRKNVKKGNNYQRWANLLFEKLWLLSELWMFQWKIFWNGQEEEKKVCTKRIFSPAKVSTLKLIKWQKFWSKEMKNIFEKKCVNRRSLWSNK